MIDVHLVVFVVISLSRRIAWNVLQKVRCYVFCYVILYFTDSLYEPSGKGAFELRHLFLYFLSLVHISEFLYAISCSLVYGAHISSKAVVQPLGRESHTISLLVGIVI